MKIVGKSAVLVIPTVSTVAFLGVMYSVLPVQVSGSFLLSSIFSFIISAFIAMSIQAKENDVHEEIMFLHSKSNIKYYISREFVIYSISLLYSIVLIIYPMYKFLSNNHTFSRPLETSDVIYGGLLIIGNGLCGAAVGDLFHHRIIATRRNAIIGLIFFSIISVCKHPLIHKLSLFKILNVLVPPVMDGSDMVGNTDIFDKIGTLHIFIHAIIYIAVIMSIKIFILSKKKYSV